jgi:hypothetical protein
MTKGSKTYETKIQVGLDPRRRSRGDRKGSSTPAMKVHAMFGDMTDLVTRIQGCGRAPRRPRRKLPTAIPSRRS